MVKTTITTGTWINMDKLIASLKVALGNTFTMYFKAHSYHWNVEGMFFSQFHDFFGDIYEDVYGAVDPLAEELRKLDVYAPISLMEIYGYKTIMEDSAKPATVHEMIVNLLEANTEVLNCLTPLFDVATTEKQQGLANFIADRMDAHKKFEWQLQATLKNLGA
jgi:starvation-inducible DNA-binding protein